MDLVNAQQARRGLDYLVGFTLSPILWRKLPGSKSAGRVQSVALRLVCEREESIEEFKSQEYWQIKADMKNIEGEKFISSLSKYNNEKTEKFSFKCKEDAEKAVDTLSNKDYSVASIINKQQARNPQPPFTTSSMQQEASRKLGFSAKKTMMIAQRLYEGIKIGSEQVGLITYMRTDGCNSFRGSDRLI